MEISDMIWISVVNQELQQADQIPCAIARRIIKNTDWVYILHKSFGRALSFNPPP